VLRFTVMFLCMNFVSKSSNRIIIKIRDFIGKKMTIASVITLGRLALISPICQAIISQELTQAFWYTVLAGITDILDGFIARYLKQETDLGAFLDAFVDKILMSAVIWTLLVRMQLPVPFKILAISIVIKEMVQLIASGYLFVTGRLQTVKPSLWGKASMCGQLFFVLFLMLNSEYSHAFSLCMATPIFVLLFVSAISYGNLFVRLIR
jgi:cardiolipin synthase